MKNYQYASIVIVFALLLNASYAEAQPPRTTVINRTTVATGKSKVSRTTARTTPNRKTVKRTTIVHTPSRARVINTLPARTVVINHRSVPYYYNSGIYYRKSGTRYIIAPAPVGIHVRVLPTGFHRVVSGSTVFFHFGGTFYRHNSNSNDYEVVAPPQGGVIYDLPDGAQQMTVDEKLYYEYNGTLYKK